jgi:small-conductance mechanosensitive channel
MRVDQVVSQLTFENFEQAVRDLATTEGRLVATGVVLVLAGLVGFVVVPFVIHRSARVIRSRLLTDQINAVLDIFNKYFPGTLANAITRLTQLAIIFLTGVAWLVIWGLVDIAITTLQLVGISLPLLVRFLITFGLFFVAYIIVDILGEALAELSDGGDRITAHQEEIILRLGHVAVLAFAITGTLSLWGFNLSGLLVGAGFLGIVVGLAARQTLGAMIAGFVLMLSRPFTIGDWVEIGGEEGIVTNITIMNTRLQNFDGEVIIIPNDVVAEKAITNRSQQGNLRIRLEVGVDYDTDPDYAGEVAIEAMEELDTLASSPPPRAVPTGFGDSAVILELRFWIDHPNPPSKWHATTAVVHAVKERFEAEGIKIPFPQRELSGREETDGFRIRGSRAEGDSPEAMESTPED